MSILAPGWFGLLALLPFIVWLHMRRREVIEVPSTLLWQRIADLEPTTPRLQRPPLTTSLLLQCAAVLIITLALVEPTFAWSDGGPTIFVLDAGAAMAIRGESGASRHAESAVAIADDLRTSDAPWSLWRVGARPEPLLLDAHDRDAVEQALRSSRASDRAPDWPAAAARVLVDLPPRGRMVIVAEHREAAAAAFAEVEEASEWDLEIRGVATPSVMWEMDELVLTPDPTLTGRWDVTGQVRVWGGDADDRPTHVVLEFRPDGSDQRMELEPEALQFTRSGSARFAMTVDIGTPGIMLARVVPGDAYPADDAIATRIVPDARPARIAVIGPAGAGLERVRRAVASHGAEPIITVADADATFVVGAAMEPPTTPAVLWLGTAAGVNEGIPRRDAGVSTWKPTHPVASSTAWGRLDASFALDFPVADGAEIVVDGVSGPLVSSRTTADRREIWTTLHPSDAAWTDSAAFLSFIGDALDWLAPPGEVISWCVVGAPCRVPLEVAVHGGEVREDTLVVARWAAIEGPFPATVERAWIPDRAGVVDWRVGGVSGRLAVRPGADGRATVREAIARGEQVTPAETQLRPWTTGVRWWILLVGVLVAVEGIRAGFGREAFLRSLELKGEDMLARRRRATATLFALAVVATFVALLALPWPSIWDRTVLVVVSDQPPAEGTSTEFVHHVAARDADGVVDVEAALETVRALLAGTDSARVLWTLQGASTRGSIDQALVRPGMTRWPIDVVPPEPGTDAGLTFVRLGVDRPPFAGDVVTLTAVVRSPEYTSALLRMERDDTLIYEDTVMLTPGATLVTAQIDTPTAGVERWRVEARAEGDAFVGHGTAETLIEVRPAPSVWVVTAEAERGERFVEALQLQGYRATLRSPHTMPVRIEAFDGADAVVLANVAALELSTLQQSLLEAWVREHGGGLTITGGERAFGSGGYVHTTLDTLSPLASHVPHDAPEVAMLFVLDRSGSMQQQVGGLTRLDIAKQAAVTATGLLGPVSQVAIVVFDEQAQVLLPWTSTAEPETMAAALSGLVPGGGTALHPGLVLARDLLSSVDSATRHIVLLTDGLSQPGDFAGATADIVALDATVSAVAIGHGADVERIREIARLGGGMVHISADFRALPGILAQEALMLASDPVVREVITPRRTGADPGLMQGIPITLPPISGFIETTPKRDADVTLVDHEARPLMATWQYGAGRVVAFTSHAVGPWAEAWTDVDAFARWWGQWLRWTVQPTQADGLTLDTRVVGEAVHVVVDARADGARHGGLDLSATWWPIGSGAERTARRLVEASPGRYEGWLPVRTQGGTLQVVDNAGVLELISVDLLPGVAAAATDAGAIEAATLAAWSGGTVVPAVARYAHPRGQFALSWRPAWRPWLILASLVWLASLVMRYAPRILAWRSVRRRMSSGVRTRPRRATSVLSPWRSGR